jgi:hypothetical protein
VIRVDTDPMQTDITGRTLDARPPGHPDGPSSAGDEPSDGAMYLTALLSFGGSSLLCSLFGLALMDWSTQGVGFERLGWALFGGVLVVFGALAAGLIACGIALRMRRARWIGPTLIVATSAWAIAGAILSSFDSSVAWISVTCVIPPIVGRAVASQLGRRTSTEMAWTLAVAILIGSAIAAAAFMRLDDGNDAQDYLLSRTDEATDFTPYIPSVLPAGMDPQEEIWSSGADELRFLYRHEDAGVRSWIELQERPAGATPCPGCQPIGLVSGLTVFSGYDGLWVLRDGTAVGLTCSDNCVDVGGAPTERAEQLLESLVPAQFTPADIELGREAQLAPL